MPATRDLATVLGAAEAAAASGDFATAADQLREALAIQEATLGASHPDLADTLNNLGVASERAQRLDDAERYYRRALAVATAAFPADHAFVATSRANLREFCEANGRPLEKPAPVVTPAAAPAPPAPPKPAPKPAPQPAPMASAPPPATAPKSVAAASGPSPHLILIGAAILIIVVILILLALRSGSNPTPAPDAVRTAAPPPASPQAAPQSSAPAPASAPTAGSPTVVGPRLCRSLDTSDGEWSCERATSPVRAGALIFLTRVKSARDTTVQHRWYRGQELVRSAQLKVAANPTEGYRTYSRYVVTAGAQWRVELRTSDGALLHEEKFSVK